MSAWYDQAWPAVAEAKEHAAAFRAYRDLLAGSGVDPYREPVFDRVWVRREPRSPTTTYGLQFAGRTLEGEMHPDALTMRGARDFALGELADKLLGGAERNSDYAGFVAFAERFQRALDTGDEDLEPWQRRFAEQVEAGDVAVAEIRQAPDVRRWTGEVLRAFEEQKKEELRPAGLNRCGRCGHGRLAHRLQPVGQLRGQCFAVGCDCASFRL